MNRSQYGTHLHVPAVYLSSAVRAILAFLAEHKINKLRGFNMWRESESHPLRHSVCAILAHRTSYCAAFPKIHCIEPIRLRRKAIRSSAQFEEENTFGEAEASKIEGPLIANVVRLREADLRRRYLYSALILSLVLGLLLVCGPRALHATPNSLRSKDRRPSP